MAKILTRGFRLVSVIDLSALSKGAVSVEQMTMISHDGDMESEDRTYEDSLTPNKIVNKKLGGNITLKGDIENYAFSLYSGGSKTGTKLFELNHIYLVRFVGLNVDSEVAEMLYGRWIGQMTQFPKQSREGGELTEQEIVLRVITQSNKRFADDTPYIATSDADPGPADATATADHDPLFTARVPDTIKTLVAAEAHVSASIVNPV